MDARTITVVCTGNQMKYTFSSEAETLQELKADLDANSIPYENCIFMEGLTRSEFTEDSAILPRDVKQIDRESGEEYITNNLVFLLTKSKEKIASGLVCVDRKACYSYIKENNLSEAIKNEFGRNYTQVSTADLQGFINKHANTAVEEVVKTDKTLAVNVIADFVNTFNAVFNDFITKLVTIMEIDHNDFVAKANSLLNNPVQQTTKKKEVVYSDSDLTEMFKGKL